MQKLSKIFIFAKFSLCKKSKLCKKNKIFTFSPMSSPLLLSAPQLHSLGYHKRWRPRHPSLSSSSPLTVHLLSQAPHTQSFGKRRQVHVMNGKAKRHSSYLPRHIQRPVMSVIWLGGGVAVVHRVHKKGSSDQVVGRSSRGQKICGLDGNQDPPKDSFFLSASCTETFLTFLTKFCPKSPQKDILVDFGRFSNWRLATRQNSDQMSKRCPPTKGWLLGVTQQTGKTHMQLII